MYGHKSMHPLSDEQKSYQTDPARFAKIKMIVTVVETATFASGGRRATTAPHNHALIPCRMIFYVMARVAAIDCHLGKLFY